MNTPPTSTALHDPATSRSKDAVVAAVLSRASDARRLTTRFIAAVGDPLDIEGQGRFTEIASGGFVWRGDLRKEYEVYDEVWPLEGRVAKRRMKALEEGAALTSTEKGLYTKRKLARFFAEPAEGPAYVIVAVTSSSGRTAYWTEIREGNAWEGITRQVLGILPSVTAAKSALRRKGLISVRDYRPRRHVPGTNPRRG